MMHTALARKWRPKNFASLVGQEHVVKALVHSLEQNRVHHAYLFTGTRGVGKTTLSRILAKAFNCEQGMTATPCGQCKTCLAIEAGHCIDYVEMDAASNRGVEEMTALLEQAAYAPVAARFKVYMIDEAHMLTQHAFNAMLKTLEEPPPHVKFILATTDPKKVPVTVLSRCLQFNLKPMTAQQIATHLQDVLSAEQIQYTTQALFILARLAKQSVRDALSLTDQAIAYCQGDINEAALQQMFGTLDQKYLFQLLRHIAAGQGAHVLEIADEIAARGASFGAALQDLGSLLHRIAWVQYVPNGLNSSDPEAADIQSLAVTLAPEQVQLYYQIAAIGRSELGLAPDDYTGFTMTLLRMLAFYPSKEGIAHLNLPVSQSVSDRPAPLEMPSPTEPSSCPKTDVSSNQPASAILNVSSAQACLEELQDLNCWPAMMSKLQLRGLAGQLAAHSELISVQGTTLMLGVDLPQLAQKHCVDKLQTALIAHFGQALTIKTEIKETTRTAAQEIALLHAQRQKEAQQLIQDSKVVQDLQRYFDANLVPGSTQPV